MVLLRPQSSVSVSNVAVRLTSRIPMGILISSQHAHFAGSNLSGPMTAAIRPDAKLPAPRSSLHDRADGDAARFPRVDLCQCALRRSRVKRSDDPKRLFGRRRPRGKSVESPRDPALNVCNGGIADVRSLRTLIFASALTLPAARLAQPLEGYLVAQARRIIHGQPAFTLRACASATPLLD